MIFNTFAFSLLAMVATMTNAVVASTCPCFDASDLQTLTDETQAAVVESSREGPEIWELQFSNGRRFQTVDIRSNLGNAIVRTSQCRVERLRRCRFDENAWCSFNPHTEGSGEESVIGGLSYDQQRACVADIQNFLNAPPFDIDSAEGLRAFDETLVGRTVTIRSRDTNNFAAMTPHATLRTWVFLGYRSSPEEPNGNRYTIERIPCEGQASNSDRACVVLRSVAYPNYFLSGNGLNAIADYVYDGDEPFPYGQWQINPIECSGRVRQSCTIQLLASFYGDCVMSNDSSNSASIPIDENSSPNNRDSHLLMEIV